jgi:hypothetical protein
MNNIFCSVVFVVNVEVHMTFNQSMEIGENGQHGHHVHVLVVVQYKNHNVIVIIQSNLNHFQIH